jgi:hypothetical protein
VIYCGTLGTGIFLGDLDEINLRHTQLSLSSASASD